MVLILRILNTSKGGAYNMSTPKKKKSIQEQLETEKTSEGICTTCSQIDAGYKFKDENDIKKCHFCKKPSVVMLTSETLDKYFKGNNVHVSGQFSQKSTNTLNVHYVTDKNISNSLRRFDFF